MEHILFLLAQPKIKSVKFTQSTATIVTTDGIAHKYSMKYFNETVLPKVLARKG